MADDAGHKAMLYFLEILMNSPAPLTISQLAGRFGSRNFTSEMRQAAGGNETGLKKFLQKYPSLFTVNGNLVFVNLPEISYECHNIMHHECSYISNLILELLLKKRAFIIC